MKHIYKKLDMNAGHGIVSYYLFIRRMFEILINVILLVHPLSDPKDFLKRRNFAITFKTVGGSVFTSTCIRMNKMLSK